MKETDLKQFASQLALWADLVIEHGRTPFRRVDQSPPLFTRLGTLTPPLVFWINRQSLMAGGIILLPLDDLEQSLQEGAACAAALGLKNFVTWERTRICIWQSDADSIELGQQIPVGQSNDPEAFRALLLDVMERLKLLSVLGKVSPEQLQSEYLHNLFQETLDSALPPLVDMFRQTRADGQLQETSKRADRQAAEYNRLTLLRLLALLWHDLLPDTIMPEKLETAIRLVLPSLPRELLDALQLRKWQRETQLPIDSAVCFHHLLLRLRQINWKEPIERARQALSQFLLPQDSTPRLPFAQPTSADALLQINPRTPLLGHPRLSELSDSQDYLATAALARHINDAPTAEQTYGPLFQLDADHGIARSIQGRLLNRRKIPREKRQQFDALLRVSWPTRRFKLPNDSPYWVLEAIHLLGLCRQDSQLTLEIPASWLVTRLGQPLCELLREHFQLQTVEWNNTTTVLELIKNPETSFASLVRNGMVERELDWSEDKNDPRPLLLLGLLLPDPLWQRLLTGRLQACQKTPQTKSFDMALLAYQKSSLGKSLWQLLGGGNPVNSAEELRQRGEQIGWPVPSEELLCQLVLPGKDDSLQDLPLSELDQIIADKLDVPANIDIPTPLWQEQPFHAYGRQVATSTHRHQILQTLEQQGLPDFPEQYLYQLDSPRLASYQFTPPLEITSELLGRFELRDAEASSLAVQGEATLEALMLCANLGRNNVELPVDQDQLEMVLAAYHRDLQQLRKKLTRQAHILLENPQAAERLSKKIWQELNLPSWKWLDR